MVIEKEIQPPDKESSTLLKNVLVIGLAFLLHFTAYSGAANLQSSINAEAGLGTASLACVYIGLVISNIFLPVFIIKWFGTKWAMCLSLVTYMPYIAAQLQPAFTTLLPAALLLGLGAAPLWCAKCTYIAVASEAHSKVSGVSADELLVRFLGMFFMVFQVNQVTGNLISSLVLSSGDNEAAVTAVNDSLIPELCGAAFLPSDDGAALPRQPFEKIQLLSGIYLACMAAAVLLVAFGVDSMKSEEQERNGASKLSGFALLAVTSKLLLDPDQMLLIIINIFIGLQQAFFGADFTAAFVSCAVGTGSVGLVMLTYGAVDAMGCMIFGHLAKLTGRLSLVCGAGIVHTVVFATLVLWRPQPHMTTPLYLIAGFWGLCDSVWMLQINAYYGILFRGREEAAFANFRLWESVGFIIAYIISPYFRTSTKTYFALITMAVGLTGYLMVEYRQRIKAKAKEKVVVYSVIQSADKTECKV